MSAVAEASQRIQALSAPWTPGENVKAAIRRASRKAGIPGGLAKRLWYGEVRRIDSELMDKLRAATADAQSLEAAYDARQTILDRLAACEAALGLSQNQAGEVDLHDR